MCDKLPADVTGAVTQRYFVAQQTQPLDSSGPSGSSSVRFNRSQLHILPSYPPPRTTLAAALMLTLGTVRNARFIFMRQ